MAREGRRTQGGPSGVGQLGRGSLLGTLTSRPRQEVADNGALWMTGSSCRYPICLLAVGGERWRGDRQGLCPPNLSPASTLALQVFQRKGGSTQEGTQEARFQVPLCCVTQGHSQPPSPDLQTRRWHWASEEPSQGGLSGDLRPFSPAWTFPPDSGVGTEARAQLKR